MLIEKLMRGPLLQAAKEEGDAGGAAEENQAMQPGPGETMDSVADLNTKPEEEAKEEAKEEATEEEAKEEEKEEAKASEPSIPKSRLDAALARAREAEAELRKMRSAPAEQQTAPASTPAPAQDDDTITRNDAEKRVSELDVEIAKALRDEETTDDQVAALIREQRELQEGIRELDAMEQQSASRTQTQQEIQYNAVVVQLEEDVPVLNPDSDQYSDELAQEVLTLAHALAQQGGRTPSDSLLLAVDYMGAKLGIDKGQTDAIRKETNIERNAAVAEKMPPDVPGMQGTSSDKAGMAGTAADAERMADTEFNALVENDVERYKQLRGDFG